MNALHFTCRCVAIAIVTSFVFANTLRAQDASPANGTDTAVRPLPPDIQKIIATGRDGNQAMAHLDYLTNRIGPRLTGSDTLQNACEWTRDMFENFGLSNSHLEKWAEWPVGFNRGPWFGIMLTPERKGLEFSTDAWTAGTKGSQKGLAIIAPTNDEELTAVKDKLAGAWVLNAAATGARGGGRGGRGNVRPEGQRGGGPRLEEQAAERERNNAATPQTPPATPTDRPAAPASDRQPPAAPGVSAEAPATAQTPTNTQPATTEAQPATTQQPGGEQGETGQGQGRRGAGRRGGGRRGGAAQGGANTLNDPFRQKLQAAYREAGILGTVTRRNNDILVTGGRRPTTAEFIDNLPTSPQINMAATSYDAIAKHLAAGEKVTLEFDIRNHFKRGPIPIHNVVADIPGSERPDEYVIVGGHIDSWDGTTGATDNGTGVASTLEAARILMASGVRPKRTIRFMLWSGEEQGLMGSRAYVAANRELMPKITGALVHDLGTQYLSSVSGLSYQVADLKEIFAPVITLNPALPFSVRSTDSYSNLGSDHRSFNSAGVPAYFWGQSGGGFNYWDSHHSQHDTFDKAVPEYQAHSSLVIALAAYNMANLDHMLARQGSEAANGQ